MAGSTMDAIKKKMQTMRAQKDAARDRAEQFERKLLIQRTLNEQVRSACARLLKQTIDVTERF